MFFALRSVFSPLPKTISIREGNGFTFIIKRTNSTYSNFNNRIICFLFSMCPQSSSESFFLRSLELSVNKKIFKSSRYIYAYQILIIYDYLVFLTFFLPPDFASSRLTSKSFSTGLSISLENVLSYESIRFVAFLNLNRFHFAV